MTFVVHTTGRLCRTSALVLLKIDFLTHNIYALMLSYIQPTLILQVEFYWHFDVSFWSLLDYGRV